MTITISVDNSQDIIDSRDIIARIAELQSDWNEATGDDNANYAALSEDDWAVGLGEDEAHELVALMELAEDGETNIADWRYGEALIRESYFTEYAEELADDIGAIDRNAGWPLAHIDWEAAADALKIDYTEIDFDGVTYLAR